MEDAVEALVNVMTDFHKSNNQPLTEVSLVGVVNVLRVLFQSMHHAMLFSLWQSWGLLCSQVSL